MKKSTCLIVGCSLLLSGFIPTAWAGSAYSFVEPETDGDPTLLLLRDYSHYLAQLRADETTMPVDDALNWIQLIDDSVSTSDNQLARQAGYVAMFSIYNHMEDWVNAESVCQLAIQDAPDSATELERLADLFAIQSAASQNVGRLAEESNARWDTFAKLQKAEAIHVKEHGVREMDKGAYGLYRWAVEERIRYLVDAGLKTEAAAITDMHLRDLGSEARKAIQPVGIHVIRHHRGIAAAMKIDSRDVEGAWKSLSLGDAYKTGMSDALFAYGFSDESHFNTLNRFVMGLPFGGPEQMVELQLAYTHAANGMEALRMQSVDGTLSQGDGAVDNGSVYEAFVLLEETLSPVLQRQRNAFEPVQRDPEFTDGQRLLTQSALGLLIDYLLLENQNEVAESYLQLGKQKYKDFRN
tara:strand:- start:345242 stop:346471 length:1230 start_codon:yes stop_codon:yes gene_type:complete